MVVSKDQFNSSSGNLLNHVPSVNLGAFDVSHDAKTHKLEIRIKVHLVPAPDSQLQLTKFATEYKKQIPQIWNKKAKIVCTKTGWDDVYYEPTFVVDVVGLSDCHFRVEVTPETESDHLMGPVAVVTPDAIAGATDGFAPRSASFGAQATVSKEIGAYRRNIIYDLSKAPIQVVLQKSPLQDPVGRQQLEKFAREIMHLKVPRKFRSSRRPKLTIEGCGTGDRAKRAKDAATYLKACGLKNTMTEKADGPATGEPSVKLFFDKQELVNLFPEKSASSKSLFKQVTVAHELGHMLGLPDEYLCMHARTDDAMQGIYSMTAPQVKSFKGHGLSIGDVKTVDGVEVVPHIVQHQTAFVQLCSRAKVNPPEFGRMTSSMMSNGMVLHPHHFVTIWEAVCQFSGFEDWRVQVL